MFLSVGLCDRIGQSLEVGLQNASEVGASRDGSIASVAERKNIKWDRGRKEV